VLWLSRRLSEGIAEALPGKVDGDPGAWCATVAGSIRAAFDDEVLVVTGATASPLVDRASVERFRAEGFILVRNAFDPGPLAHEIDTALREGLRADATVNLGGGGSGFQSVVLMCELTPVSLSLLDELAPVAARLLDRGVVPGRAKGTRYTGDTDWHRDSDVPVPGMSFVAYLESLNAANGALRVRPQSHADVHAACDPLVLDTEPGDLIAFDDHLMHSSVGGTVRRQWRIDFGADPANEVEESLVRGDYARILDGSWDLGDDVERYPSFGPFWRTLDRPWTTRLGDLGVYELADRYHAARLSGTEAR